MRREGSCKLTEVALAAVGGTVVSTSIKGQTKKDVASNDCIFYPGRLKSMINSCWDTTDPYFCRYTELMEFSRLFLRTSVSLAKAKSAISFLGYLIQSPC
jgi:hypothetical protein